MPYVTIYYIVLTLSTSEISVIAIGRINEVFVLVDYFFQYLIITTMSRWKPFVALYVSIVNYEKAE